MNDNIPQLDIVKFRACCSAIGAMLKQFGFLPNDRQWVVMLNDAPPNVKNPDGSQRHYIACAGSMTRQQMQACLNSSTKFDQSTQLAPNEDFPGSKPVLPLNEITTAPAVRAVAKVLLNHRLIGPLNPEREFMVVVYERPNFDDPTALEKNYPSVVSGSGSLQALRMITNEVCQWAKDNEDDEGLGNHPRGKN